MSGGVESGSEGRPGRDAPGEQRFPLTLGQRWIAASSQNPGRGVPLQRAYRLYGDLDTRRLLRILTELVAVNETLRLRLHGSDGLWEQSFPDRDVVVDAVIPTGGTESERFLWALGYISQAAAEPLDLEFNGPFSVQLVRLDRSTHLLALTIDHLAVDGIGFDLLEDRLDSESAGSGDQVTTGRFVDYLEQNAENRDESERALRYWLDLLRPLPSCPPTGERVRGKRAAPTWSGAALMQVMDACREHHWSPFMALVAAQALLMARLSGTLDAVLSVPFSNRITDEERNLVANLATLGYVPVWLSADERLHDYRERVRRLVVDSMGHRNVDMWELGNALSRAAQQEGRTLNLVTGCSFTVDLGPGRKVIAGLVAERLDVEEILPFALPAGTFVVSCNQGLGEFDLELLWDPGAWPLGDGSELFDAFRWVTCAEDSVLIGEYVAG